MRGRSRAGCLTLVAIAGLAALAALYVADMNQPGIALNRVAAWMPTSWDAARADASWQAHRFHIQELSPVWYQLGRSGDGALIPYAGACDTALVAEAQANGTLVIPLVNNAYGGIFDPAPVGTVIHDPARRAAHVAALVNETVRCGYDGIELDYESLHGLDDRADFTLLVQELAAALHGEGKLLAVTVHPKTAAPGTWEGPQAQDWSAIGAAADRVRVMVYGYHWGGGPPGPIAPLFWTEEVIEFAVTVIPPQRVYLGLHLYGLDWGAGAATTLEWEEAQELLAASGATQMWADHDAQGRAVAESWFTYDDGSTRHEVWYADGAAVLARLRLVKQYGLGGVALWRLGGEDPADWWAVATVLHPAGRLYVPRTTTVP